VELVCAGRTDRGVHASGQVVHFDTTATRAEHNWILGCNANLPGDVRVHWCRRVPDIFHARFGALARRYSYVILEGRVRSALWRYRTSWTTGRLDVEAMSAAGAGLVGRHDFSSFRAAGCQARQPVREVLHLEVTRRGRFVVLEVSANAFLHHMVRNFAGVLLAVGTGERPGRWVEEVLRARDRRRGGGTAPAQGLYLTSVTYPERFGLSAVPVAPVFW
jgi:tRNA pseudouridine38-40 synthase